MGAQAQITIPRTSQLAAIDKLLNGMPGCAELLTDKLHHKLDWLWLQVRRLLQLPSNG